MPQNCGAVASDEPIMNKSSLCPKLATVLPPTRLTVARRKANRGTAVSNRCAGNGGNGAAGNFAFAVAGIDGGLNFISCQCDIQLSSVSASKKFPKRVNRHEFYPCDAGQTKAFTFWFGDSTRTFARRWRVKTKELGAKRLMCACLSAFCGVFGRIERLVQRCHQMIGNE